jgi:hypothetical protein
VSQLIGQSNKSAQDKVAIPFRWHAFLLFLGYSIKEVPEQKPNQVAKIVNEFALEYRTTREKILQYRKRLADKRERNKTRGKIWALEEGGVEPSTTVVGGRRRAPMNAQQVDFAIIFKNKAYSFSSATKKCQNC